jgi:hypothetical protein
MWQPWPQAEVEQLVAEEFTELEESERRKLLDFRQPAAKVAWKRRAVCGIHKFVRESTWILARSGHEILFFDTVEQEFGIGRLMKGATILATLRQLGVATSFNGPRVRTDNRRGYRIHHPPSRRASRLPGRDPGRETDLMKPATFDLPADCRHHKLARLPPLRGPEPEQTPYMNLPLATPFLFLLIAGCASQPGAAEAVDSPEAFLVDVGGEVVTPATYPTHETSRQILITQAKVGVNEMLHKRELTPTDNQPVVRMNRDTYYSFSVVDVSEGASITIPEVPEGKYVSVQPVTEDHRIQAMRYGPGTYELSTHTGAHLYVIVRLDATLAPAEVHGIQDGMSVAAGSSRPFTATPVNRASFTNVENTLKAMVPAMVQRDGVTAAKGMFTDPRDASAALFTEEKYQVGAASGWGGAQWQDNIYEASANYPTNQGYQATFEDPGNAAFWSFTVYDKNGFMFDDLANRSSNTATPNADGTFTISFGCGPDALNNIPIANPTGVFNVIVRHYRPSERVREGGYRLVPFVKPIEE